MMEPHIQKLVTNKPGIMTCYNHTQCSTYVLYQMMFKKVLHLTT